MLPKIIKSISAQAASFERKAQELNAQPPGTPNLDAFNQFLAPHGYALAGGTTPQPLPSQKYVEVKVQSTPSGKWHGKPMEAQEVKRLLDPVCQKEFGFPCKPLIYT